MERPIIKNWDEFLEWFNAPMEAFRIELWETRKQQRGPNFRFSPPRDNRPPTCEEQLAIAEEMGGRDMQRFAR